MRVLVDADSCPVKDIIKKISKKYSIPAIWVCDTSHQLSDDYCEVITVDKFADSADLYLINLAQKGDLVVTQDYGVAALALGKKAYAMNNFGMQYTDENIEKLLFERFLGGKVRRAGGKTSGPKKRANSDNKNFEYYFEKFLLDNC